MHLMRPGSTRPAWDHAAMTTRRVAWRRSDEIEADEHCTMTIRDSGLSLVGTVLGTDAGTPVRIEYRVLTDRAGLTSAVHVRDLRGFATRTITIERDTKGRWTVDGLVDRGLKGCLDIDLGCSPSTNTLPIRRLRLGLGTAQTIQAAWVRFPELVIVKAAAVDAVWARLLAAGEPLGAAFVGSEALSLLGATTTHASE